MRRVPGARPTVDEADTTVVVASPEPAAVAADNEPTAVANDEEPTVTASAPPQDDEATEPVGAPAALPSTDATKPTRDAALPTRDAALPTRDAALPTGDAALPTGDAALPTSGAAADADATRPLRLPVREPGPTTPASGVPGERTQVIPLRRPEADGDRTQVIRAPSRPLDGERTQVVRLGLPVPTSEGIEVIRLRSGAADAPVSIAGAEAPAFGDDPTSRIVPPAAQPDEPNRTMTVMSVERPPDNIPAQRKPGPAEG